MPVDDDDRPLAFIACPIGNKFAPRGSVERTRYDENIRMWEEVFESACEATGLRAIRADKISESGEITDQIFRFLRDADIVIVDVSDANPNVMYELAARHTLDRPTVVVGQYGRLPFDINTIRTIQFKRTEGGLIELRDQLVEAIESALAGKGSPVSLARVFNEGSAVADAAVSAAVEASSVEDSDDDDEPGVLELLAEGERGIEGIGETLGDATATIAEIGAHAVQATQDIHASDAAKKGIAGRLLITRNLAITLTPPADEFASSVTGFVANVASVDAMVRYIAKQALESEDDRAQLQVFFRSVLSLVDSAEESATHISSYGKSVAGLRKVSSTLKSVSRSLETSVNSYLQGIATITEWRAIIEPLIDPHD